MTYTEIVRKLIGKITPVGDANIDEERYENLKNLCNLIDDLVGDIADVKDRYEGSYEASVKKIGQYAKDYLSEPENTEA